VGNVSHIKRTAQAEYVREKGYEKDVWASECGSKKRLEKNARWWTLRFALPIKYHYGDHIREDEMVGTCGTHWGEQKYTQVFGGEM